ncbi:MAG TPA: DNRLRE domain-containing protein [Candidatus Monoglobus merdigallinarum]|uniref:DNRLRE domain-containing protein n=1 Tax=Candidatus Monoglobus merdigallinarum TaxID=2838698 RepID=A0A9D1PQ04_9FIRM|nr:DNRLRE domain-containing protein [Candidatus Monoglobus merdigallinarum]
MEINLLQKIIGCVLALFLVLGTVPVGLFYFAEPVIAEGSVVKIPPADETFVCSEAENRNRSHLDDETLVVGSYWNTYFKFDLSVLSNTARSDISQAKLRLPVVWSGLGSSRMDDCSFNVSWIDNNSWNDGMTWSSKPMGDEQYLCTASGALSNNILEIDLSEFIRSLAGYDGRVITIKLSPSLSNNAPIMLGSQNSDDPTYRPYLKILIGEAYDTDRAALNKSYLDTAAYVSAAEPDTPAAELLPKNNGWLVADSGSVTYLKFRLDLNNIVGAVEDARIFLRPKTKSSNTKLNIYLLDNSSWNAAELTYNNRPEGEAALIRSYDGIEVMSGFNVDVTDIIYNAVNRQDTYVTFMIDGTETDAASTDSFELYSSGELAPSLAISSTDDENVVALREAVQNLKGANDSFDNITSDLPGSYVAGNGRRVTIRWSLNRNFSLSSLLGLRKSPVTNSGEINQPLFFEDERTVEVRAELSCGGETLTRHIVITIRPEFGVSDRLAPLNDALE